MIGEEDRVTRRGGLIRRLWATTEKGSTATAQQTVRTHRVLPRPSPLAFGSELAGGADCAPVRLLTLAETRSLFVQHGRHRRYLQAAWLVAWLDGTSLDHPVVCLRMSLLETRGHQCSLLLHSRISAGTRASGSLGPPPQQAPHHQESSLHPPSHHHVVYAHKWWCCSLPELFQLIPFRYRPQ